MLDELLRPIEEARYLLDRGYRRGHAFRVIGEHHQLSAASIHLLERVVFAEKDAASRLARLVDQSELTGRNVVIDGYNVVIGLRCWLGGQPLFLADDGVVRDVAAGRGLKQVSSQRDLLHRLVHRLAALEPESVLFVFDRQVSRSGELAFEMRRQMRGVELAGDAVTVGRADREIINRARDAVVCSSDRVIMDAAPRVFDLVRFCIDDDVEIGVPPLRQ